MKYLFLYFLALPCLATAICIRFLGNLDERAMIYYRNEYAWRWNSITGEFNKLEASAMNGSVLCSVQSMNDLRGKTLIAEVNPLDPIIHLNADRTAISGLMGDMWMNLETALGFKTIYRKLNMLRGIRRDTNVLLSPMMMQRPMHNYFDYSMPFSMNSYALFVQSEGETVSRRWYVDTFSGQLWIMSYIFLVGMACSIMAMYYVKKYICANYLELYDELTSPVFSLFYIFAGISGQGFPKIPQSWSLRLIILSCLILGLLLSCGFNSNLTSNLANRRSSFPITNLQDLIIKRSHILCMRNDSNAYTHFTVDGYLDSDLKDEWKNLVNIGCPDMMNTATFASQLCRPGFVYLEVPNIFRSIYNQVQQNCNIIELPDTYWNRKMVLLHTRSSPYRDLINLYIMKMNMYGILVYLHKKWFPGEDYRKSVNHINSNIFQPVEFEHMNLAFCSFSMMVVVSVIICILENIWYRLWTRYKKINSATILLGARDNGMRGAKTSQKSRPKLAIIRRRRKASSLLLPGDIRNQRFLRNVAVRVDRW